MQNDMIVQVKLFDLLKWLIPLVQKFPRAYRFTVTQRMTDALLDFQESLVTAQSTRGRKRTELLAHCDAKLTLLRIYLRLAHEWQWLSDGQYRHVSNMVAEIGRLLGGWIKQAK